MKPAVAPLALFLVTIMCSALAFAQPAPEGGGDRPPDGPPPRERMGPGGGGPGGGPGRDGGPGGGPDGRRGPGMMGPGGPGGPGGGGPDGMARMRQFELLKGYLDAVDRYARLAHNPNVAGIAAVVSANDMLKSRSNEAVIDYFTKLLPEVKSTPIQRAIRLQLAETYKVTGQQDKALEQLKVLMTAEPGAAPGDPTTQPPGPGGRGAD